MLHGKGRNLIKNAINNLTGRGVRLRTLTTYLIAAVSATTIIMTITSSQLIAFDTK